MAEQYIQLPADSSGKKVRTRERTVSGNTVQEQYFIQQNERVASYRGFVTSFRTLGNAASPQNLFTIENTTGSAVIVALRRLTIQMDATAVLTAVACVMKAGRPTAVPSGGTTLSKAAFDTTQSSAANVTARGATASDGGTATAITSTMGTVAWQQFVMRLHTAVGQVRLEDEPCIPVIAADDPIYLRANEAFLLQATNATAGNNAATNHYLINCMWEEFTLP